jgi:hypothetical protein
LGYLTSGSWRARPVGGPSCMAAYYPGVSDLGPFP